MRNFDRTMEEASKILNECTNRELEKIEDKECTTDVKKRRLIYVTLTSNAKPKP